MMMSITVTRASAPKPQRAYINVAIPPYQFVGYELGFLRVMILAFDLHARIRLGRQLIAASIKPRNAPAGRVS
jgi:hypothetical protein